MKVRIYAHFCEFEARPGQGYKVRTHRPLDPMPYHVSVDVKNAAELESALQTGLSAVRASHPGKSFFVSQFRERGDKSRAFAGYNRGRFLLEFDHTEESTRLEQAQAEFGDRLQIVSVK